MLQQPYAEIARTLGATKSQVGRDVQWIRKHWSAALAPERFDARAAVGELRQLYRFVRKEAIAHLEHDPRLRGAETAGLLRVCLDATVHEQRLYEDCGLLDRKLGELRIDPDKAATERIPTGLELRAIADRVRTELAEFDATFMSEGERKLRFGSRTNGQG